MQIKDILLATSGTLLSGNVNEEIKGFSQDTRTIHSGDMYIPLVGQNHDGHMFIEQAFQNGASCVLTSQVVDYPDKNVILVKDTLQALGDMAKYLRLQNDVKVVAVTGSVGKTSTKDMIYSVVSTQYKTLKTLGNYNNHIGLPLTMLRYHGEQVMILEMGMNHLGEIDYLSHIAKPDIAVITNVGTAHIGELGSRENILKAKMEIVHGLKENGWLIVNGDNDLLETIHENHFQLLKVGYQNDCDLKAFDIDLQLEESYFSLEYNQQIYRVHVPVSGMHFVYNALLSIAVGIHLSIPIDKCIQGIEHFQLTQNRMDIIELGNHVKVIDGSYNANLDSMKSSLDVLSQYPNRKIAILADMLELGEYEEALHREVGKYVCDKKIDVLICIGKASLFIKDEAISNGMKDVYHFDTNDKLIAFLKDFLNHEDVVLLKGSNGMKLKEVVMYLKENL